MKLPTLEHPEQDNSMLIKKGVTLCAILDTVRKRKDGTYSVKIRLIHKRIARLYSTKVNLSKEEFKAIATTNPRKQLRQTKVAIYGIIKEVHDIIKEMDHFSFKKFGVQFFDKKSSIKGAIVYNLYENAIQHYKEIGRIGNSNTYYYSRKSLLNYSNPDLTLHDITPEWLKGYENQLINVEGKSPTTVGMYLRPLRAIFNQAIADKIIPREIYPFRNNENPGNYQIPTSKKKNRALNNKQLKKLFEGNPKTPEQQKAKDFWFFSYACNGMNIADIVNLKNKNIDKDKIVFERWKTMYTKKKEIVIEAFLNDFTLKVLEKYRNKTGGPNDYVFPIIEVGDTEEEKYRKRKNFLDFVNQHFKKYAKSLGFHENLSSYWARHSFSTKLIREGANLEMAGQCFGHASPKTTADYFAGFENEDIKRKVSNIMKF